jgi:hypothetical protein
MKNQTATFIFLTFFLISGKSQTFIKPNYALKSHETLEISKIEITSQNTIVRLSLENRRADGYFCADKNIYIIYPDGSRSRLTSSKGIPVCPETYKFKAIGEKLEFELSFPSLRHDTQWIDLVEDCKDNCFSFYGICLNSDLNKKIDDASVMAENKEPQKALMSFINIAGTIDSKNAGIEGLIYMNIINLAKETGNIPKASEWYQKLKLSGIPRSDLYIKHLNSQGIIF